jgi:hypothetical protein
LNRLPDVFRRIIPLAVRLPLPVVRFQPAKERGSRVKVGSGSTKALTFYSFLSKDGQRHVEAVLEVKNQNRMLVGSTLSSDDAISWLHGPTTGVRSQSLRRNERTPL